MSPSTREIARPKAERWFYRTERGDFGPVSTDELLAAIKGRTVDLRTEVKRLGGSNWSAAADERVFRDHYAACRAHWEEQELHAEADRLGVQLNRAHKRGKGAWIAIVLAVAGVIGGAALLWWRLSRAEPIGLLALIPAEQVGSLPVYVTRSVEPVGFPRVSVRTEPLLAEVELLDTAGIRVGGPAGPVAQKFEFDEHGEIAEIPAAVLASVTEAARQGLIKCAIQLATTNTGFSGTEVVFSVTSGRLANISVGREVAGSASFRACVKSALNRVAVPKFQGSPRRVTVPLRVGR